MNPLIQLKKAAPLFYLFARFRLILLAGSALTLALFGRGVAVADVLGVGDFNGDGKPDYLLEKILNGASSLWPRPY